MFAALFLSGFTFQVSSFGALPRPVMVDSNGVLTTPTVSLFLEANPAIVGTNDTALLWSSLAHQADDIGGLQSQVDFLRTNTLAILTNRNAGFDMAWQDLTTNTFSNLVARSGFTAGGGGGGLSYFVPSNFVAGVSTQLFGTAAGANMGDFDAAGVARGFSLGSTNYTDYKFSMITLNGLGAGSAATHDVGDFDAAGAAAGVSDALSPFIATAQSTGETAFAVAVLASNLAANITIDTLTGVMQGGIGTNVTLLGSSLGPDINGTPLVIQGGTGYNNMDPNVGVRVVIGGGYGVTAGTYGPQESLGGFTISNAAFVNVAGAYLTNLNVAASGLSPLHGDAVNTLGTTNATAGKAWWDMTLDDLSNVVYAARTDIGVLLPAASAGYLKSDGSGGLSWDTPSGGGGVANPLTAELNMGEYGATNAAYFGFPLAGTYLNSVAYNSTAFAIQFYTGMDDSVFSIGNAGLVGASAGVVFSAANVANNANTPFHLRGSVLIANLSGADDGSGAYLQTSSLSVSGSVFVNNGSSIVQGWSGTYLTGDYPPLTVTVVNGIIVSCQ